jgi:hypothetical protein
MPSIINASSSGSGGLVQTADASGVLQLQSNGTLAVSISGATTTLSGNMVVNNQVSSSGDLNLDAVFSVMIKKSGSTNATINQFGIGLAGSNLSSGIGIAFPASQSASSDANTLDDYEEGSWTPALTFGGNSVGVVYSAREARYVKIGRSVFACCLLVITSKGSSSGIVGITLPFTTSPNTYSSAAFSSNGVSLGGGAYNLSCQAGASAVALNFYNQVSGSSKTACTDAQFANNSEIIFGFTYEVA